MTNSCIRWLQQRMHPDDQTGVRTTVLVATEIVRWLAFVVPITLAVWRWAHFQGYTISFTEDAQEWEFWVVVAIIFITSSVLVYLPTKLFCVKFLMDAREEWGWRPSILQYILLCALPCMALLLAAVRTGSGADTLRVMDEETMIALQMTVLGLTITEWMAKLREEVLTYDLVSALAVDFFFAYDVIDFLMMLYHDNHVFETNWMHVQSAVVSILVTMFCQDVPFIVVRVTLMILWGFSVSDILHPLKNFALIVFGALQLYIMYRNSRTLHDDAKLEFEERRTSRNQARDRFINVVNRVTAGLQTQRVQHGAEARPAGEEEGVELPDRDTQHYQNVYPALKKY